MIAMARRRKTDDGRRRRTTDDDGTDDDDGSDDGTDDGGQYAVVLECDLHFLHKNIQYPNPIFKTTIYCTEYNKHAQIHLNKSKNV